MTLSDVFATMTAAGASFRARPGDDWRQGQTLYGGLSAALAVQAAGQAFSDLPPLRSAQFAFVGPAVGALAYTPVMVRRGKSSAFILVAGVGDAGPATQALLCYGAARTSDYRHHDLPKPGVMPPEEGAMFFRSGDGPTFSRQFDARQVGGDPLVSTAARPFLRAWVRHRDAEAPPGLLSLIALGDVLPPAAMALFSAPAPISTMTWSVEIPEGAEEMPGTDWYLFESVGQTVEAGYSIQDMTLWHESGRLALVGRQTVALYG